ncbi:MAG: DUF3572 domain-containing protein [Pseudolabrys sp.]|nr:DUF3572 domain-containing protein [Pseudolabrys sp.]
MKSPRTMPAEAAEGLAIQALTFLAGDPERLGRFLSVTGLGPDQIRAAAGEPGFLAGVLAYLASDEKLAAEFTLDAGCAAADIARAHNALGGEPWEREIP